MHLKVEQAGAELGQAQVQFKLSMKFNLMLQLEFSTSPGGWWVGGGWWSDIYEIRANLNSVVVEVEV